MTNRYKTLSVCEPPKLEMEFYYDSTDEQRPARVYPPHVHDCLEIYVLEEGDVSFIVESSSYKLTAGDAIVCKPNEIHNCVLNTTGLHKHFCFWFGRLEQEIFADLINRPFGKENLVCSSPKNKERLLSVCKAIDTTEGERVRYYRALELIDILCNSKTTTPSLAAIPPVLKCFLEDANENFTEISSLDYFTQKYFLSASTLNRLFKKHLNTTPSLYLETKRLAYSKKLLQAGKSVFDACIQAGFSDYSNYIRLFKKRFGKTPKHYKEGSTMSESSNDIYR